LSTPAAPLLGAQRATPNAWEQAYLRFETPEQEQRKFVRRLREGRVGAYPPDAVILDLFSGRGGCAEALRSMGFRRVVSLDLSETLLRARGDTAGCSVADCRELPIADRAIDVATVHGGLHHLPRIPVDLSSTLREVARVLKPDGLFFAVEPWRTPFLDFVHWLCKSPLVRTAYSKIDALATMIELERTTYEEWLDRDREVLATFDQYFTRKWVSIRLGKLYYLGSPRPG